MTDAKSPTPAATSVDLRPSSALYAVVAMVGVTLAAIVGISIGGPEDPTPLVTTIIGFMVPIIGVVLLLVKVEQVHRLVNTRSEQQDAKIATLEALLRANGGHTNGDPRPEPES